MDKFSFLDNQKLLNQLKFAIEIDKMKEIFRINLLADGSRRENDAEHSWHFALMAMLLEEYSAEKVDVSRVMKIALVHDLVEVYAGDTYAYDAKGNEDKAQREKEAADKLFGMLEPEQEALFRSLWDEFEEKQTPEARYANAIDRIQPLILNYITDGATWQANQVHSTQILKRMDIIRTAAPELWPIVQGIVKTSIEKGILLP